MKYLIAGLGNIGSEYVGTRHNIGFDVLDTLAVEEKLSFVSGRHAAVCEYRFKGRTLLLIKPTTYMNLSGKAVRYWLEKEKIPRENLLVICDDIALPLGSFRMKPRGNDGGHNGLLDIGETLQSFDFPRLRIGIGNDFAKGFQVDFVLGRWEKSEIESMLPRLPIATQAIRSFATQGLERSMNIYNKKAPLQT